MKVEAPLAANRTSPAQRLMPELLEMIFQFSTAKNQLATEALNLSHVCRNWRATALDMSSIWSSISVQHIRDISSEVVERLRASIQHQLKLSKTSPINVDVLLCFEDTLIAKVAAPGVRGILEDLVDNRHRWRTVSIRVFTPASLNYRICLKETPLLEELTLNLTSADHPWHCVFVGHPSCPKLSRLELAGDFRLESCGRNPRLRSLSLRPHGHSSPFPTVKDYFDILRNSPVLESVTLKCLGRAYVRPMSSTLFLRSLRELTIEHEVRSKMSSNDSDSSNAARNAISLLGQLTLPSLQKLKISIQANDARVEGGLELRALVERSCPPLRQLIIEGCSVSNVDLILALRLLPQLTHLRLKGSNRYLERLFAELTMHRQSTTTIGPAPITCPNLRCLRLSECIIYDWSVIARMILSRWNVKECAGLIPNTSSHFEFKEYGINPFLHQKVLRCITDSFSVEVQSH